MALTPPPPVPQRGDRVTFSDRVDNFLTWMANLVGELNVFLLSLTRLAAGGANSFAYGFDSAIADADPGNGRLRLNSATQNTATAVRLDALSGDGSSMTSVINAMLSGTSAVKAGLRIQKVKDPSSFILFDVTGGSGTGYFNLNVVARASSSANPFSNNDDVVVYLERVGDKGDTGVPPVIPYLKVSDRQAQGGGPQTLTAGAFVQRTFNTLDSNTIPSASLAANSVSLPAGLYDFKARAPAVNAGAHRARLQNLTLASTVAFGSNATVPNGGASTDSFCTGRFTLTGTASVALQHYASVAGPGGPVVGSGPEIYSELEIWKVG